MIYNTIYIDFVRFLYHTNEKGGERPINLSALLLHDLYPKKSRSNTYLPLLQIKPIHMVRKNLLRKQFRIVDLPHHSCSLPFGRCLPFRKDDNLMDAAWQNNEIVLQLSCKLHIAKLNGRICGAKRSHSVFEQPNCYQSV